MLKVPIYRYGYEIGMEKQVELPQDTYNITNNNIINRIDN